MTTTTIDEDLLKQASEEAKPTDPLASENQPLKKMLLQKYGVIPPQLTTEEAALCQ